MPLTLLDLRELTCCSCGNRFAMAPDLYDLRMRDKKTFWCPAGHEQHFTGDNPDQALSKAKAQVHELKLSLEEAWQARHEAVLEAREARKDAGVAKAKATRAAKRAAAALCPAEGCQRSFVQLHRHIVAKHPELLEHANG